MKITCRLELEFEDRETARSIHEAVKLDNEGYIESRVEGSKLVAETGSDNIMTVRNTLDDYLACVTVAQKASQHLREP